MPPLASVTCYSYAFDMRMSRYEHAPALLAVCRAGAAALLMLPPLRQPPRCCRAAVYYAE